MTTELEKKEELRPLTNKQKVFVEFYLACWNATEAARRAGYSPHTANEQGARLLANASVKQEISDRTAKLTMSANEVLVRLADHARGSIEDFLNDDNEFNLKLARQKGKLHLIKKIKFIARTGTDGLTTNSTEVELHDPQAALVHIGRALKLFVDRQELTGKDGGPIEVQALEALRQQRWTAAAPALAQVEESAKPSVESNATEKPSE